MKIKISPACKLIDLPEILKKPVLLNLEKFKKRRPEIFKGNKEDFNNCNICDFEWINSVEVVEYDLDPDVWIIYMLEKK